MKDWQELLKKIDELEKEKARLEGRKTEILSTLKQKYGVKSLQELEKLIDNKQKMMKQLEEEIQKELGRLKQEYPECCKEYGLA